VASVLIVDDSATFRALAARLVRAEGHQVAGEAADAAEALRLAEALSPDGVLLDVHLGADDGFAVRCALAALARPPRVIMISGDPDTGALPKADLAGQSLTALLLH
jgi:chemotaxis response regulator CheB